MSLIRAVSLTVAVMAVAQGASAQGAGNATSFTIRVENISKGEVLKLSTGKTAPFVSAPTFWAVHAGAANPIFRGGQPAPQNGLEQLAETGNPEGLVKYLSAESGIAAVGAIARPVGATGDGPLTPGQAYEFELSAEPGQSLSIAWMFGQSNDLFYSNGRPIALFSGGQPVSGDMTAQIALWDAGTEMNEEPGLGEHQAPRQTSPEAGTVEHESIAYVRDKYRYPRVGDVLRLTITPSASAMSAK